MTQYLPEIRHISQHKKRILVIDDDCAVTDLFTVLLLTQGFAVSAAHDGRDGLLMARTTSPDLIVLDLLLPGMDGWEVCSSIRAFSAVPIIVLSAVSEPSMVASVLDAGADHCLTKPVPSYILMAHIRRLFERVDTQ